jgi:alkylation response protein AidB-like acyl-CoA dehydrogenase
MDFAFNEEQQMLVDATRRFITEQYSFEYRRGVKDSPAGFSRETWKQLADLGLLALTIPEQDGGIGGGPVDAMLVSTVMGEGMLLEPFESSAIVATQAIVALGSDAQRARWLPAMSAGDLITVLTHDEETNQNDVHQTQTVAKHDGTDWIISGKKSLIYHAPLADMLLVSAQTGDGKLGLFAIASNAKGVHLQPCVCVDDQRAATLQLDSVRVPDSDRLGDDAAQALQDALDYGLAALCADAFGAMDKILKATVEYSKVRVQFGAPIGSFQALQHRMTEMLMHLEQARSMMYLVTNECNNPNLPDRNAALSAAKVLMGQAARYIGQQAVQLHGGMGMTDELNVSHYFKRLLAFELRCGTSEQHLERYRRQLQVA